MRYLYVMQICGDQAVSQLTAGQQTIENVDHFTYLGSVITDNFLLKQMMMMMNGDAEAGANCRIGVFQSMRSIWTSSVINIKTNIWLYNVVVLSVVTYACETWKYTV